MVPVDNSTKLYKEGITKAQSIVVSFLYCAQAIDNTMQVGLNDIGPKKSTATKTTLVSCKMLYDSAYTYPDAVIQYHASDMSMCCDTHADFLVQPNSQSFYARYFISAMNLLQIL